MSEVEIDEGAVVCADVEIEGNFPVRIGPNSVVGPKCRILATCGPVDLGEGNIVEELVTIQNLSPKGSPMRIGNNNLFQVGSRIASSSIGDLNLFQVKCDIECVTVGSGCVVGTLVSLKGSPEEYLPLEDSTVAFRKVNPLEDEENHQPSKDCVQFRKAPRVVEQHRVLITRYLDILQSPESKSALSKFHKLR